MTEYGTAQHQEYKPIDNRRETGKWHRELNATIGYSNPTKVTFGTACNIIVEKIYLRKIG